MTMTTVFWLGRWAAAFALASLPWLTWAQAPSPNEAIFLYQGADREARLMERAKQEGSVTWYTSFSTKDSKPLIAAFEKKTGVKVNMWRGLSDGVVQRVLSEGRSNLNAVDVIETNGPEVEALAREKMLARIYSPYMADVPARLLPKHGLWIPDRMNFFVVAYNTRKVRREDLPKTYEGFLDPKWKGRIALEATDSEWMAGVVKVWGEQRGMDFFDKLSATKPAMRKGHVLLANLISVGEVDVGLTAYQSNASSGKQRGEPIDWAAVEPVIGNAQAVGVARMAPHPHAALLFADFMLSPQAQEMMAGMGRGPVSSKVKSETSAMDYVMTDPGVLLDESEKWQKLWDKAFLGR